MQIQRYSLRLILVFSFLFLSLLFFSLKLVFLQVFQGVHLANLAQKQHNSLVEIDPVRGGIYDCKMRPLAFNVPVYSVFANPRQMDKEDKQIAAEKLSKVLNVDKDLIKRRLKRRKYFVWIKRKLSVEEVQQVKDLDLKGISFKKESKRFYPNKNLGAHLIGFSGTDNVGLEGLELLYDNQLKGESGWLKVLKDAKQRQLFVKDEFKSAKHGGNLVLTLDETVQYIAETALDATYKKSKAISGSIIVMNISTGEILALANRPTYNLGAFQKSSLKMRTNRAVVHAYEPGSVFKIVALIAALEESLFQEEDIIFCENGEYRIANHILHDHHGHGNLTFQQVFEFSSNIGVAKIAQKLGPSLYYKYARRFRFGMKTGIDLMGEIEGVLKSPNRWSKTSIGAIPMGHEVLVTPLQLICALSAIANDGVYMRPFVVKSIQDSKGHELKTFDPVVVDRIMSPETARRAIKILTGVVDSGTGKRAQIEGIKVAGKTGTAQKVVDGKYSHSKFYSTFMGFAPADNPKIAVIVMFDEPKGQYFGGTVAAPVFQKVVSDSLKYLD